MTPFVKQCPGFRAEDTLGTPFSWHFKPVLPVLSPSPLACLEGCVFVFFDLVKTLGNHYSQKKANLCPVISTLA